MDDLISRQAAIDAVDKYIDQFDCLDVNFLDGLKTTKKILNDLPSAQPERKKGKWIGLDDDAVMTDTVQCSVCRKQFTVDADRFYDIGFVIEDLRFCPNCGARMDEQ